MEFWKTITVLCTVVCIGYCDDSQEGGQNMTQVMESLQHFFPNLTDLENKCRLQTNREGAFDRIEAKQNQFTQKCLFPLVELYVRYEENLPQTIMDLSDRPALQKMINDICGGFSRLKKCLRPVVDATLVCFTPTERINANSIWNAAFAGVDYACKNKGARYIELLETGAEKCIKSREIPVTQCWDKLDERFTTNGTEEIQEFNSNNCNVLNDASSCSVTELTQCPSKRPAEITQELVGVVLKKLTCVFQTGDNPSPIATIRNWILSRFSLQ